MDKKILQSFKVQPVDIDESRYNKEELGGFEFPSTFIGIGAVAAGKSTLMFNLIRMLKPVFDDNIIVFSPTATNDPILLKLVEDEMILEVFESYSNETLQRILEVIRDDEDEKQKYLIIFDDILGMENMASNHISKEARFLNSFISTYRHGAGICQEGRISCMWFIQYYKSLLPTLRVNASYVSFLGKHSEKNIKQYAEELSTVCGGSEKKFFELWRQCKSGRYDFMTIDLRKLRVYRNLDNKIYDDFETNNPQDTGEVVKIDTNKIDALEESASKKSMILRTNKKGTNKKK
jgi:hypothetical protein